MVGITVEDDVSAFFGEDGVVATHAAVLTGEPMRAALSEDDVARDNVLLGGFFGAETFSGTLAGAVGAGLFGVRGVAGLLEEGSEFWEGTGLEEGEDGGGAEF